MGFLGNFHPEFLCDYLALLAHLYQLFNMDYRQARSCNKSLFPQSGITGQETKVSLSDASHWIELIQEQLPCGMGWTADHTAIPQDCPQDSLLHLQSETVGYCVCGLLLKVWGTVTEKSQARWRKLKHFTIKFFPHKSNLGICQLRKCESQEYN